MATDRPARLMFATSCCAAQGDTLAGAALGPPAEGGHAERILVREYESGRLLREQVLTAEELEAVLGKDERRRQEQDLWSSGSLSSVRFAGIYASAPKG